MSGFVDRIEPHLMNQSKLLPSANILIVVKKKKRKAENTWNRSLPKSYFLL